MSIAGEYFSKCISHLELSIETVCSSAGCSLVELVSVVLSNWGVFIE